MSVTATILSEGAPMDPTYEVLSIEITREVSRIPTARLLVLDGRVAEQEFTVSNADFFEPGKEIEIQLRHEDEEDAPVFKGLVVRHGVESNGHGSMLQVDIKDAAVKLTHPRKSFVHRDKTDDTIIGEIIEAAGLTKGTVEAMQPEHPELVQYYCTDWDFVVSRADVQGLVVVSDDGTVDVAKADPSAAPKRTIEWGLDEVYRFEITVDGTHQPGTVESVGWDLPNQAPTEPSTAAAVEIGQGNLDPAGIATSLGYDTCRLTHPVPVDAAELQAWADARMTKSRLSMIRGTLAIEGTAELKPLDVVEIAGIGDRFNGNAVVTGVRHRVDRDGWLMDLQFGLSPAWFSREDDITDTPAAGLLPAVSGLQIGKVAAFEEDPDGEFRVKVIVPGIDSTEGALWARLVTPDAGLERGYFFRPEPDDEVVVGFLNDDPRQPIVLGAMYSSTNTPHESVATLSEDNVNKAIVTKKGTTIGFADTDTPSVFIQTPAENKVLIDDESESIVLSDQHGNSITMDSNGITITSAADFKIDASGNVEIAGSQVDVK